MLQNSESWVSKPQPPLDHLTYSASETFGVGILCHWTYHRRYHRKQNNTVVTLWDDH